MVTTNSENHIRNILVLSVKIIPENKLGHPTKLFPNISDLNEYIYNDMKNINTFELHIPGTDLEELIRTDVQKLKQVRCIYVYYGTDQARQTGQNYFESALKEAEIFKFCVGRVLGGQLENVETGGAVQLPEAINHRTIHNVIPSIKKRLPTKRKNNFDCHSPEPKQFVSTVQNRSFINNINRRFICPFCKTVFQEPYELECGHRLCQSCLISQNRCPICSELIAKEKAWFDRAFQKEKQHLLTTCLVCKWEGPFQFYQEHVNQNHPEDSIPNEQIAQNSFHQQTPSALRLQRLVNNNNINYNPIQDTISGLLNTMNNINDGISAREMNSNLLYQEHLPLQERAVDTQTGSFDGTLIWKITNYKEKRINTPNGQKSIYSSPFYSSQTGYKMCLRLFVTGDTNARGAHISLYLVIMRGDYDTVLRWPLKVRVTFTLLNQVQPNNNQSKCFWSDTASICFQQPNTDMNIAYGFSEFFPLDILQQNENYFIRNNTMLVKAEVECLAEIPDIPSLVNNILTAFHLEIPRNDDAGELMNEEEYDDVAIDDISAAICLSDNPSDTQQSN